MTTRLTHGLAGYVRSMQMSSKQLWIFIEGKSDRAFYDGLCAANCSIIPTSFLVTLHEELPGKSSNGKEILISFFKYLRRKRLLCGDWKGKRTGILFCFDKDIDDLLRKKLRSKHVVYTDHYTVENYLYRCGDLPRAIAAASQLDKLSVIQAITDGQTWLKKATYAWLDWVACCLLVRKEKLGLPNYKVSQSKIHTQPYAATDQGLVASFLIEVSQRLNVAVADAQLLLQKYQQKALAFWQMGQIDKVFNGKWYDKFIEHDVDSIARGRSYEKNGLGRAVRACLLVSIDFRNPEFCELHKALDTVASLFRPIL